MGGCQGKTESAPPTAPVRSVSFRQSVADRSESIRESVATSLRSSISSFAGLSSSSVSAPKPVPPPMPTLVINEVQNVPTSTLSRLQAGTKVDPPVPSAPRRSASTPPSSPPLRSRACAPVRPWAAHPLGRPHAARHVAEHVHRGDRIVWQAPRRHVLHLRLQGVRH